MQAYLLTFTSTSVEGLVMMMMMMMVAFTWPQNCSSRSSHSYCLCSTSSFAASSTCLQAQIVGRWKQHNHISRINTISCRHEYTPNGNFEQIADEPTYLASTTKSDASSILLRSQNVSGTSYNNPFSLFECGSLYHISCYLKDRQFRFCVNSEMKSTFSPIPVELIQI